MADKIVEELQAQVAALTARLEKLSPTPKLQLPETAERYLEMALSRMNGDVTAAANLFFSWTKQDSQVEDSLRPIIQEAIERRLAAIPRTEPELDNGVHTMTNA